MENIIDIIKRQMQKQGISGSELARRIGVKQPTALSMLQRRSLKVSKLADISKAMQYNFFREISQHFPYENPVYDAEIQQLKDEFNQEINILKQQIQQLTEENKTLQTKTTTLESVIEKLGR